MDKPVSDLKTNKKTILGNMPFELQGRIPPHSRELEEAVLGAMMLERDKADLVIDILTEKHFYLPEHQYVFKAIYELHKDGKAIDLLTVNNELRNKGHLDLAGGSFYLAQLTNKVSSGANIEFHARLLSQKFIQRELIRVSGEISVEAFNDSLDAFAMLDESEKKLYEIKNASLKKNFLGIKSLISRAMIDLEERGQQENDGITGVASGFMSLDTYTAGWQKSDLIILAARPAMGKTAFAMSLARNAAVDFGKKVLVFSLEMADVQLVNRLISAEAEIPSDRIRKANLTDEEWSRLHTKTVRLGESSIFIDDTPQLGILDLNAKCRRLHSQTGLDMVIIDYLQLLRFEDKNGGNKNREQEIAFISRALKGLAKELQIPVIALAQLSRAVESRQIKIPQLSDLRESGSIEQDADMVMFLYRDEYYNKTGANQPGEENNAFSEDLGIDGLTQVILAKNRHGAVGRAYAKFIGQFSKFVDLTSDELSRVQIQQGDYVQNQEPEVRTYQSRMNDDLTPRNENDNPLDTEETGANIYF